MQASFYLKAQDSKVGIFRYYHISIVPTLFNDWALLIAHGRIGHKARQRTIFVTTIEELAKRFKNILTKRLKAERRLGCNYQLIEQQYDEEFKDKIYASLPVSLFYASF